MAESEVRWRASLALALPLLQAGCMPASWGAAALLHPLRRPLTTARPAAAQDVEFESDGLKLKGWLFRGAAPRRGTVIYLHGSADNRGSGVYIAQRFLQSGFDVLAYDSRAHGESEGTACTYGYYEKRDLSSAIDLVGARPVVALGVSLGGAVALQAAAEDLRIRAVVAVSTFSDLRTVASERAPSIASKSDLEAALRLAEEQAHFKIDEASPLLAAPRINVPVFLVHGQVDHETAPAHSQRVFAALQGNKRLLLVPGAGHNDVLRPEVWMEIDAWLDRIVPANEGAGPTTGADEAGASRCFAAQPDPRHRAAIEARDQRNEAVFPVLAALTYGTVPRGSRQAAPDHAVAVLVPGRRYNLVVIGPGGHGRLEFQAG